MSNQATPIKNAQEIIDRFGGIRPMATKTGVAVTTIQGWKKRGAIPAARRDMIISAAQDHGVDLSTILGDDQLDGVNDSEEADVTLETTLGDDPLKTAISKKRDPMDRRRADVWHKELADVEKRVLKRSLIMNAVLLGLLAGAVAIILLPNADEEGVLVASVDEARIEVLEENISQLQIDVDVVEEEQGLLEKLVPENLDKKIAALQEKAAEVKDEVSEAVVEKIAETKELAQNFVIENADWTQRLADLEDQMSGLSGASPLMAGLMERYGELTDSEGGQALLSQSTADMAAALAGVKDNADMTIDQALEAARVESDALGQSFANVPTQDLKAAALLLAMSQFRNSLNRGGQSFSDDYQVLRSLMGEDNIELNESLDRLAPHAASGVLTPEGLNAELRSLTGDIVMASLRGEDVSVKERATARFNEVLQVQKDGELITGTDTQATVLKAETLLNAGDLEGAIAQMMTLEGEAAEVAAPWVNKAEATALAAKMQNFISQAMNIKAFGSPSGMPNVVVDGVMNGLGLGSGELIQDKEHGVNILVPASGPAPVAP